MKQLVLFVVLTAAVIMATGCATGPELPAIAEPATDISTPGRWVWVELFTDDAARARSFYGKVFGWEFEQLDHGKNAYTLIRSGDRPIGGIVHSPRPTVTTERAGRWIGLMSVPDAEKAAEQAIASGGEIIMAPRRFKGRGTAALLSDPEKAFFGVIHSESGDPPDTFPPLNSWLWMEMWARDVNQMAEFYSGIGGYTVKQAESGIDRPELYLVAGGYPRAGIIELQRQDLPSAWLPYIRVEDLSETLDRVRQAGGNVFVEPNPEIRKGMVAVIIDPLGAAVGLAEWPEEGAR